MKNILYLIPFVLFSFSGQDKNLKESDKIRSAQIKYLQGENFIQLGIRGQSIRIAILDGGFIGTNTHPALKHLMERKQVIATWNFVRNCENVYTGVSHGTEVLSCIAGISEGQPLGLAPDAEFLLALTERRGEPLYEEINWAKAVDWAVEHGANIIQSSLGYTHQRYFTSQLDGRHSIAAKAAIRAARKGVLIINCNGNEGLSRWKTLVTPADADSILSVGAIDPETGLAAGFSSVGPTSDKRMKPNVSAPGTVLGVNTKGGTHIISGTSFSAPLITGFAACAWQLHRSCTAQEIISLIEKSGHLYPYYDYAQGFGIPQASNIINPLKNKPLTGIRISADRMSFTITLPSCNKDTSLVIPSDYFYYHISDPAGFLKRYGVYHVVNNSSIVIGSSDFQPGDTFRCFYNGEFAVWKDTK
ncbi:MAG: S8 family serine peptidase [Bacteroidales bacterium]|jgi:hypothetical protein